MTGLNIEIEKRKNGKHYLKNDVSYSGIAKVLDCSYPTAKRKCDLNYFTVSEALLIYNKLFKTSKGNEFDAYKYLFTEQ